MGTVPTTDNKAAEILDGVISALMSGGEKAAEAYIIALDPAILATPFGTWLVDEGVSYVGQILSIAGQKFANEIVIDIQANGEQSSVITTATSLQYALASGDTAAITLATKNASDAWGGLIRWDGSVQPK